MSAQTTGHEDLPPESHFEIYNKIFQSPVYDIDLTRMESRKAPDWVTTLALWKLYRRTVRLHVSGETWYRVNENYLQTGTPGSMYVPSWRTSLSRLLKFADRLFCYPEQASLDPSAGLEMFLHPARLRDIVPPNSIEFEVLCDFDLRGAVGGSHEPIFVSKEEKTNIRALLWLFKRLQCHNPDNRHRLDIVLKWKDIRYTRPNALVLECHGGLKNTYAYTEDIEFPTKAAIPNGLGIKERYIQVIEEGLDLWKGYLIEKETKDSLSDAQKAEDPKSKYWAPMPDNATKTFKIVALEQLTYDLP